MSENTGIEVFADTGDTVQGARFAGFNATITKRGRSAMGVVTSGSDFTRATGRPPVGIIDGEPTTSVDGSEPGADRPMRAVTDGACYVVAAVALDPANPAHLFLTPDANHEATPEPLGGANFIGARLISPHPVAAGALAAVVIDIR